MQAKNHTRRVAGISVLALTTLLASTSSAFAAPASDDTLSTPTIRAASEISGPQLRTPGVRDGQASHATSQVSPSAQASQTAQASQAIPGVGPKNMAKIPKATTQVLVSTTPGAKDVNATTTLWQRGENGWTKDKSFAGHNGKNGWLADRREGDKTTPAGVFSLTAAGGYEKNPGTSLPYTQDKTMNARAVTQYGSRAARVFDYVIAIDFNRKPGTPPRDGNKPLGPKPGSGIWLHVDHGSGTNGCVTVSKDDMKYLLLTLKPQNKPYIVMGATADISA